MSPRNVIPNISLITRNRSVKNGITTLSPELITHMAPQSRRQKASRYRRKKTKFSSEQVISALRNSAGVKLSAARMLGCSPSTVANYIDRFPEVAAASKEIIDEGLDIAESVILRGMKRDDNPRLQFRAAITYLRAHGASRGYGRARGHKQPAARYDYSRLEPEERALLKKLLDKALIR